MAPEPVISKLVLTKGGTALRVEYADGDSHRLPAVLLRSFSPSAETGGRRASATELRAIVPTVHILRIEPVGHYAIQLYFDDGHDTGLYTFTYLGELATNIDAYMERIARATESAND